MRIHLFTYTGDGNDGRTLSLPFTPDVFICKHSGFQSGGGGCIWTSAMTVGESKNFGSSVGAITDGVKSVSGSVLTLGDGEETNTNGTAYMAMVWQADNSDLVVGTYTGNAVDDRKITTPFEPEYVIVGGMDADPLGWRVIYSTADRTGMADTTVFVTDGSYNGGIKTKVSDGFTIGSNFSVNADGGEFFYIAVKRVEGIFETAQYTGDGVNNRQISTGILGVDYVHAQRETGFSGGNTEWKDSVEITDRPANVSYNYEHFGSSGNKIKAFRFDVHLIGTDSAVNLSGARYSTMRLRATNKIGDYDIASLTCAWLFNSGSQGNMSSDIGNGEIFPVYQPDGLDTYKLTLAGFTTGGFNASTGTFDGDGDGDGSAQLKPAYGNSGYEMVIIRFKWNGNAGYLFGQYDDADNHHYGLVKSTGVLERRWRVAGSNDTVTTTTQLVSGNTYTVAFVQDNGNPLRIFIDTAEAAYGTQGTYGHGDKTFTDDWHVLDRGDGVSQSTDNVYGFCYVGDIKGQSYINDRANSNNYYNVGGIDNGDDTMSLSADFPTVTLIDPSSGTESGGTSVTITGTNFEASQGTGGVTFDGVAATIDSWSDTSIECTTPAGSVGNVDVVITNDTGLSVTETNGYEYTAAVASSKRSSLTISSGMFAS